MKKHRILCLILAVLLTGSISAASADFDYGSITTPHVIVIDAVDTDAASPIYEHNADERLFPASTTKILTTVVALENASPDQEITVGSEIQGLYELKNGYTANSSLMGLVEGETLTLRDLLYGLMLVSGNEAADAIAVAVGGSIENFVAMMNAKAQELGMTNSHFKNPNGVNHNDHYTTARDMAKLTAYALNNPQFATICSTDTYTVPASNRRSEPLVLNNSNLLLTSLSGPQHSELVYEYCIGVKTGLTQKAGSCLVAAAEKDGARAIICLYGDDQNDKYIRFSNAKAIFEELFTNTYTTVTANELNLPNQFSAAITHGRPEDLDENGEIHMSVNTDGLSIRLLPSDVEKLKANSSAISADVNWKSSLVAPIRQGQLLGTVTYRYNGKAIFTTELTAPSDVLEVAILAPDESDADAQPAPLLTEPSPSPVPEKAEGNSKLVTVLIIAVSVLVLLIAAVLILRAVKKAQKKKRRRQRMAQRRAAEQQSAQRNAPSGTSAAHTRVVSPASGAVRKPVRDSRQDTVRKNSR